MKHIKSERLKKLEGELNDLEQWLKLGLVPKKDVDKHKEEIEVARSKIEEEKERLQFLKESGESEEYVTPKRNASRAGYNEMPTVPDIDLGETLGGNHDTSSEIETDVIEVDHSIEKHDDDDETNGKDDDEPDDESYFSDRNRWRRGGIIDPDANDW